MDLFGSSETLTPAADQAPLGDIIAAQSIDLPEHIICYGHHDIEMQLLQGIHSGRLPHGLVFYGIQGIGKYAMAMRLARALLSQKSGCGNDMSYQSLEDGLDALTVRRMNNMAHPDFMVVGREYDEKKDRYKDSVSVDSVRKIPAFLQRTSSEGGWRVVIVDDADTMNRNAQNAILKILEEPPQKTVLILIVHRMGALLPTIRSRTQMFGFSPLSDKDLQNIIHEQVPMASDEAIDLAVKFSRGSADQVLSFLNNGGVDVFNAVLNYGFIPQETDWGERHACADSFGKGDIKDYKMFTRICLWVLDECIRYKAHEYEGVPPAFTSLSGFYARHSVQDLIEKHGLLKDHFVSVEVSNLDRAQGVLKAFFILDR